VLLLFLSFMMFSHVRYPSFKGLNWRTQRSLPAFLGLIALLAFTAMNYGWMPAFLFVSFLVYGFVRPFISKALRREIEDEVTDEETPPPAAG
jgi:CDP-diacylglycerol--serine O-phosphatidyltransferase